MLRSFQNISIDNTYDYKNYSTSITSITIQINIDVLIVKSSQVWGH